MTKHYIFCDDAPSRSAGGFGSVLGALFDDRLPRPPIGMLCTRGRSDPENDVYVVRLPSARGVRFNPLLRLPMLVLDWFKLNITRRLPFGDLSSLCIWVGNDWTSILRGMLVARRLSVDAIDIYVVDDIFNDKGRLSKIGNLIGRKMVSRYLSRAARTFAISSELAEHLGKELGGKWQVMALPFRLDEHVALEAAPTEHSQVDMDAKARHFAFVGALAPSTLRPLRQLYDAICVHNDTQPMFRYYLHIVSRSNPALLFDALGDQSPTYLVEHGFVEDEFLGEKFAENVVFVAPYDEEPSYRYIVDRSFPSKILKTISIRRPTSVIAPASASVVKSHGKWVHCSDIASAIGNLDEFYEAGVTRRPWERTDLLMYHSLGAYLGKLV